MKDADVVIIPESAFHKYDVPGMIASDKKVILVIEPWDDSIMMQYISDYDVSPIRASMSTKTLLNLIKSLTNKTVSFADTAKMPKVKEEVSEKKVFSVEVSQHREEFTIKINRCVTDIPKLELPALLAHNDTVCVSLPELHLRWKKEKDTEFKKLVDKVLEKVELIKFAKKCYYDPIPLPYPGGQYFIYTLPEKAGSGIDKVVFEYRVFINKLQREAEKKQRIAAEIRKRAIEKLPKPSHTKNSGVIAVAPFKGFEHCIKIDTSELDYRRSGVPLLIGYAFHANFPEKQVIVHTNWANGKETLDANFEIGNEIKDYFINEDKGGVIVKAKKIQDDDLVLEYKNRRIRIPRFFSERMNFAYAYLRYRRLIDAIVQDIDKEVNCHIMENKEAKIS